jgi:REP element-mobilizing transposase RayT
MKRSYDGRDRRSIRLANYDYRECGAYFVTLCTYARDHLFGEVKEGELSPNDLAALLPRIWARTVNNGRMPQPCDFVVMPNHVHGTVWLSSASVEGGRDVVGARHPLIRNGIPPKNNMVAGERHPALVVASPLQHADEAQTFRECESGSLGAVVGSFKATAARAINRMRGTPGLPVWQRGYYERVVRADGELGRIRQYIQDNPKRWPDDPNNVAV